METLTGPMFYLLVAWGIVTAIFLVLLIWRSLLKVMRTIRSLLRRPEIAWPRNSAIWCRKSTLYRVRLWPAALLRAGCCFSSQGSGCIRD